MVTVADARELRRADIKYLVVITPQASGPTVYCSSDPIVVNGQMYGPLINNLQSIGDAVSFAKDSSAVPTVSLEFTNRSVRINSVHYENFILFHDSYPLNGATIEVAEMYSTPSGDTTPAVIFKGLLDAPHSITEKSFRCRVSSLPFYKSKTYERPAALEADFADLADEDKGKKIPTPVGDMRLVPAIKSVYGIRTTLASAILYTETTSLEVSDATGLPATSGELWVNEERIQYATRSGNTCSTLTRGVSTTDPMNHGQGSEVIEYKANNQLLISDTVVETVSAVYGRYRGELVRISGWSQSDSGGKTFVTLPSKVTIVPVDESLEIDHDSTITDTYQLNNNIGQTVLRYSSDLVSLSMYASYSGAQTDYVTFTTPSGSPTSILVALPWVSDYYGGGTTSSITSKINGTTVATHSGTSASRKTGTHFINPGSWDTSVTCQVTSSGSQSSGTFKVGAACGSVATQTGEVTAISLTGTASQDAATQIGGMTGGGDFILSSLIEEFFCAVEGIESDAAYYGTSGVMMERPDYVVKWYLVKKMGFASGDIDSTSFDAAGSWYSSNSYTVAGWDDSDDPLRIAHRIAFECRSVLRYVAGTWYLDVIPDTSPAASMTIARADLVGASTDFRFGYTPIHEVMNVCNYRFDKNFASRLAGDEWRGAARLTNIPTGHDELSDDLDLRWVRDSTMAASVVAHILKRKNRPFRIVEFPVFWENFGLGVGDTFSLSGDIFAKSPAYKYYAESVSRIDRFRAKVRGVEWF